MLPEWSGDYIGLPYRWGARGPEAFDCWGLVEGVMRTRFAVDLPSLRSPDAEDDFAGMARVANEQAGGFVRLFGREHWRDALVWPSPAERPGDIVLMRRGAFPCHVGVVVASDWMIHCQAGIGVAGAQLRHGAEARNILALYRHPDLI
ncbi:NlpC/P60 family protein [Niveispirillum sp.]|uniref:C40 family peptidase n=1 Tax=Niveispirillum sp. TaxID=1917217 RepID=UPI001B544FBA|nr:NlpC/P60 family protein [Niveispirillum sp.]MBP7339640.1 C40 family peptidase [Niveispirillum sp.]